MTQMQVSYLTLLEERFHNRAVEAENYRSNVAREQETYRHNVVTETETNRHNVISEQQGWESLSIQRAYNAEIARHNAAVELETNRANVANETIARERAGYEFGNMLTRQKEADTKAELVPSQKFANYGKGAGYIIKGVGGAVASIAKLFF